MKSLCAKLLSDRVVGGFFFALIVLALFCACLAWVGLYTEAEVEYRPRWSHGYALLLLLVAYFVAMLSWYKQLQWLGVDATLKGSFIDIAMLSVGKYFPGKALGILVRGYRPKSVGWDRKVAFQSFLDQMILLASGVTLAAFGWVSLRMHFSVAHVGLSLLGGLGLLIFGLVVVGRLFGYILNQSPAISPCIMNLSSTSRAAFLVGMSGLCWVFTTLAIFPFLDVYPLSPDALYIGGVFLTSFLAGWLVVFMPAGAGVREGVFVILAAPVLDYDQAFVAILGYRLVGIFLDISLGLLGTISRVNLLKWRSQ